MVSINGIVFISQQVNGQPCWKKVCLDFFRWSVWVISLPALFNREFEFHVLEAGKMGKWEDLSDFYKGQILKYNNGCWSLTITNDRSYRGCLAGQNTESCMLHCLSTKGQWIFYSLTGTTFKNAEEALNKQVVQHTVKHRTRGKLSHAPLISAQVGKRKSCFRCV